MKELTSVHVELLPFGSSSFPMCVADVYQPDQLTVSCLDELFDTAYGPAKVFAPGTWCEATVLDARGNVLYAFTSVAHRAVLDARYREAVANTKRWIEERKAAQPVAGVQS